jgi:hypothetical protein
MKPPNPAVLAILAVALAATVATGQADGNTPEVQQASRLSRLQGKASLGRNRQVVGATVLVQRQDEASRLFVTVSDSRGSFRIDDLPDGDYRVEVRREGLAPIVKRDIGLRFPFRAVVELIMEPVGTPSADDSPAPDPAGSSDAREFVSVAGTVVERGGQPMSDVVVRLVRTDGGVDPRTLRTGTDGTFQLVDLTAGQWRLQAQVVGYLAIWTDLVFQADTNLMISMVLQPAGYDPSPLELMPPEQPIPPAGLSTR